MRTVLETLASTYPASNDPNTPPQISFVSINAEELPDISEQYDVTAVPFVVLQKEGVVQESISGSDVVKVRDAIERFAGPGTGNTSTSTATKQTIPPVLSATPRETVVIPDDDAEAQAPSGSGAAAAPAQESKESLFARLGELVKAAPIMLFMKGTPSSPQCGFSRQLVGILRENGVKYGFFNILADEDVRQGLKEFADWPTYPQLWVSGELVGGLDIVSLIHLSLGIDDA